MAPPGLPLGFVRISVSQKHRRLDLFGGCPHPNFDEAGSCLSCSYNLWTPIRKQIRNLEMNGPKLSEHERVDALVSILTAPFSISDGLRYVGVMPRLPRHLRPAGAGSHKKEKQIQEAIKAAEFAANRKRMAVHLVDSSVEQFRSLGLDDTDIFLLKDEVTAFLDAYLYRFHFQLDESDLWPLILAYGTHIGEASADEVVDNYFLDTESKKVRYRWWHSHIRISEDMLGRRAQTRYER